MPDIDAKLMKIDKELHGVSNHITSVSERMQELSFRAQRMYRAKKKGKGNKDDEFSDDLRTTRKFVRGIIAKVSEVRPRIKSVARQIKVEAAGSPHADSVGRASKRLEKQLMGLFESAHIVYQYCVDSGDRNEAWFMAKELEPLTEGGTSMSTQESEEGAPE